MKLPVLKDEEKENVSLKKYASKEVSSGKPFNFILYFVSTSFLSCFNPSLLKFVIYF